MWGVPAALQAMACSDDGVGCAGGLPSIDRLARAAHRRWAAMPAAAWRVWPPHDAAAACSAAGPAATAIHPTRLIAPQLDHLAQISTMDADARRKAAAEARRLKVLARGGDRLAKITGSIADQEHAAGDGDVGDGGRAAENAPQSCKPVLMAASRCCSFVQAASQAPQMRRSGRQTAPKHSRLPPLRPPPPRPPRPPRHQRTRPSRRISRSRSSSGGVRAPPSTRGGLSMRVRGRGSDGGCAMST